MKGENMGNGRTGITWTNEGTQATEFRAVWWVRLVVWLLLRFGQAKRAGVPRLELPETVSRYFATRGDGHPPCERWAGTKPLVVISASAEHNIRQNTLEEAARAAEALLEAPDQGPVDAASVVREVAGAIRRLMTDGPVLASNPLEADRVPDYYLLACMYRDLWEGLAAEWKRTATAKEERDAARAELAKVKAILHDAETTPAGAWAVELAAAKENAAGVAVLLEEAEAQRLKASAALQSVRSDFVDRAVSVLNEALQASPEAITELVGHRVECRADLLDHPTVQVLAVPGQPPKVGMLGLINGILGLSTEGFGPVTVVVDTDSQMAATFQRSVPANRGALGVSPGPLEDLAIRADLADQAVAAMKMRALQAEEALTKANDLSGMYREAWAALGAPDCGLLKWRSVLDEIEAMREERDQISGALMIAERDRKAAEGLLSELTAILVEHVRDESAPEVLKRLIGERAEAMGRMNTLLSMLGPRCGETGIRDERAEGALRRILDQEQVNRHAPAVLAAAARAGVAVSLDTGRLTAEDALEFTRAKLKDLGDPLLVSAANPADDRPVMASLFPLAKGVLAAALNWFDAREGVVIAELDGASQGLVAAVEEWVRRGPNRTRASTAAEAVDEAEARARRELVEGANLPAIICDPRVFRGKPSLRGARLAVEHLLGMMSAGDSVDDLLRAYPKLDRADVLACLKVGRLAVERLTQGTHDERARCARIARTLPPGDEGPAGHAHGLAIAMAIEAGGAA